MTQPIKPINPGTLHKMIVKAEAPKPDELLQVKKSDYDRFFKDWNAMSAELENSRAYNKALKFRSWVNVGISAALSGALCLGTYWFTRLHYDDEVNKAKLQGLKTASELLDLKTRADAVFAKPVVTETKKPAVAYEAPKAVEKPLENIVAPKSPEKLLVTAVKPEVPKAAEKPLENLVSISYKGLEYQVPKNEADAYEAIKKYESVSIDFKDNHVYSIALYKNNFSDENCKLDAVPPEILQFGSLEYLDLGYNKIRSIEGLDKLKKLKHFDLRNNMINYVPPEILQLGSLEHLNLNGNKIKSIKGLDCLKKLKYFSIVDTEVDYDLPETKAVLESLRAQGAVLNR